MEVYIVSMIRKLGKQEVTQLRGRKLFYTSGSYAAFRWAAAREPQRTHPHGHYIDNHRPVSDSRAQLPYDTREIQKHAKHEKKIEE